MTLTLKRTENHNFTITTNTSQHVEFFHSLDISLINIHLNFFKSGKSLFLKISLMSYQDLFVS